MSLMNVCVTADKALVSVDTLASFVMPFKSEPARYAPCGKLLVLAHQNAVVAGVGAADFLLAAHAGLHAYPGTFDDLLAVASKIIESVFRQFARRPMFCWLGRNRSRMDGQVLNLVGWSETQQRVIAMSYEQESRGEGFLAAEISKFGAIPWDDSMSYLLPPDRDERILEQARAQAAYLARVDPDIVAGGQLLIAEISRGRVEIRNAGDLGFPAGRETWTPGQSDSCFWLRARRALRLSTMKGI